MNFFEVLKKDPNTKARLGIINTAHGPVSTPAFLPIGTHGSVKAVTTEELKFWGAEMILANTYHLWLRPGDALIHKAGGLHKFIGWDGPVLSDSGGFQVFSLGEKSDTNIRMHTNVTNSGHSREDSHHSSRSLIPTLKRITIQGIEFQNELDGTLHLLTPESSMQIQSNLGSDIDLVLADVPGLPASEERIKKSLALTLHWAERAKRHFEKILKGSLNPGQKLFGIVQGGDIPELREKSVKELQAIGFDGYGIGGLAVGEAPEIMYKVLESTLPFLEEEKPRHLLGVGYPEQIIKAVSLGIDTFDCVLPTRNARHGELFVNQKGSRPLSQSLSITWREEFPSPGDGEGLRERSNFYQILKISNEQFKEDFTPVDNTCNCYLCLHHNRAYLRHLFMTHEPLGIRLTTMHDLRFYLNLMEKIRRAIEFDSFSALISLSPPRRGEG